MSSPSASTWGLALRRFLQHCHCRAIPANTVIITAGDQSDQLYYLVKGSVSVLIADENDHEILLAYLNTGDFFGEIGMFDEEHERSAWVRTRTHCEVAQMSHDRLRRLATESPELLFALLSQLALRLRDTSRKMTTWPFPMSRGAWPAPC